MLCQSATYGTKYRVRQFEHKTICKILNSRILYAAVSAQLDFHNKVNNLSNENKEQVFEI